MSDEAMKRRLMDLARYVDRAASLLRPLALGAPPGKASAAMLRSAIDDLKMAMVVVEELENCHG